MARGPEHQRLADYIVSAHPEDLFLAEAQWRIGSELLRQVSKELETKANGMEHATTYTDSAVWSGATASTAREAFTTSSQRMNHKADEMQWGAAAFAEAANGVQDAQNRLTQLDQQDPGDKPTPPTFSPGPRSHADEVRQSNYDTASTTWARDHHANETAAAAEIARLQQNHHEQAKVFQRIHGEKDKKEGPFTGGGGSPVSTGSRPGVSHVPTTVVPNDHNNVPTGNHHDPTDTGGGNDHDTGGGTTGPGGGTTIPGGGIDVSPGPGNGLPAGPTTTTPVGPLTTGPTTASGGSIGAVGGVGAVAGGAMGGIAAAGLAGGLAGGVNGGLNGLVPAGGRGGLSSSGVRGIGSTSRTGVGSVLGRGNGTAGAGGMATRNSRGSGRGGRGAAGRGSRGSAGGRGAGAAAGAGRGGKDKKRSGEDRDLFDDGQDWLDDEAQPGLLD